MESLKAQELKQIREKLDLSREQFADFLGLPGTAVVEALEAGLVEASRPTLTILRHLNSIPKRDAAVLAKALLATHKKL